MISMDRWKQASAGEQAAWNTLLDNFDRTMKEDGFPRHGPVMWLERDEVRDKYIVDLGGGPISMLYHFHCPGSIVVDPLELPQDFIQHYLNHGIIYIQSMAESWLSGYKSQIVFDEIWIYNCLQHVLDPELILSSLRKVSRVLRISEPLNVPTDTLHPHMFTEGWMREHLTNISEEQDFNQVMYDYPYFGGRFVLK